MNKITSNYRTIVNSMIKKSFPTLNGKRVFVFKFKSKNYSGAAFWLPPFARFIFLNERYKNLRKDKAKLVAVAAHELSHLERFQKKGWLKYGFEGILYWISASARTKEDRETDKLAIEKGYAKELYAQKISRWRLKNKSLERLRKYYLSPEEVKLYAKSIGKWQ